MTNAYKLMSEADINLVKNGQNVSAAGGALFRAHTGSSVPFTGTTAFFALTKAQSEARNALGMLASDMDLDPGTSLQVPPVTADAVTSRSFNAKQRRVQALAEWNDARVDLVSKLGVLGREDMQ